MEFGDQTKMGERGIDLRGGQKQRIQLARAVYQDYDIYLLDDVFSAVDAHTGSKIFKECVKGALRPKTVLLVTHQVDFLHNADLILVMRDGQIVQSGKYDELLGSDTDFVALVTAHDGSMELVEHGAHSQDPNIDNKQKDQHITRHLSIYHLRKIYQAKLKKVHLNLLKKKNMRLARHHQIRPMWTSFFLSLWG